MKKTNMDNKGFSLIELIIVIAIMAVLVAIIAPNLSGYLSSSKKKTDRKNADEMASQLQNCITTYESDYDGTIYAAANTTTGTISWSNGTASGNAFNSNFIKVVNKTIPKPSKSKENSNEPTATIKATAGSSSDAGTSYEIEVTVGNAKVTK